MRTEGGVNGAESLGEERRGPCGAAPENVTYVSK
jgi:hypothetical protein